ncbi:hypothetical protein [Haliscomenobacter hydrossis]|uniref:Ig-like domain-containing protein n=1 Tax=Haliscomenobacter hydrossis (strain ATCC 27775 / DSM 1100 / LMG 10767 / O) TaxID=760192 RepID=F4L5N0_HALH1|nr:hypothetical protein [Haliscomenobacter hydrossis]AEE51865.1 hypothetical protein Halhy_4017 [Haliscomenobacter hydrossis DSM 1100]
MKKTTTCISYCLGISFLLLSYCIQAQHVDGSSQSSPIIVPQSQATAYFHARTDIVEVKYAFAINGGSVNLVQFYSSKTDTEVTFNLTNLNGQNGQGKVVEIQRQVRLANNTIDASNKNYYVYPFTPIVSLSACDGKITARDNSGNDTGLKRTYELYQNGNLIGTPLEYAGSNFEFPYAVQAGLSYTVKIKIFSTGGRPGSNGYVYEGSGNITIPTNPSLSANLSSVCAGKEVRLTATGGGTYQWSTGSQTASQISVYPTNNTTYTVSVTQSANCVATRSISINVHPSPVVSIDPTSPICVGSAVQLRARGSGGTPGYVYNWSRDNGDQSTFAGSTSGNIVIVQPTASTGYRVTITDGNGCESTAQAQVMVNPNPTASIDPIPATVNVGSNLTLTGRSNGGTTPYQYSWSNNAATSSITITATATTTYRLTVSDNKSCTSVAEVLVTVSTQPKVTIAPVAQPICAGVATVLQSSVSGGTSPYTYLWSNGATTSNTTVSPSVTSTYGLTVTDQQGKKDSTQVQVLVHPKPVPSIQGTQPNCAGESTIWTASGGSTYLWTGGATTASIMVNPGQSTTYYVTVKNTHNCSAVDSFKVVVPAALQLGYGLQNDQDCTPNNVTVVPNPLNAQAPLSYSIQRNGATTLNPSLSNLTTDNFTLIVTDNKGCTASTQVSINEVPPLRITLSKEREHDCTPGNTKINMSTTGARGAVSYRLDGGEPYNFTTYLNIPNGLHTVTAQDAFGCITSDTVRIAEDSLLVVTEPLVQHVTCPSGSDGSISLSVRGGIAPYYFNWSNLGSSTHVLSNIPEGNYAVTVVDSRNCQVTKMVNVTEPGDIGFGAQRIVKYVTCNGGSDGSLEITTPFSGGTAPYSFLWSNGATTNIASNLSRGQYGVTITDAKGCQTAFWSTGISEPAPIKINSTGQYSNHLDCIANNVSINVAATGGRGGYNYSLDGGAPQNSGIFTGQSNGTHQLEVKDSANCSQTFTIQVVEHAPFTLGYRLENDQDCIPYNTTIVPLPQNAQGNISYILVRNSNININPTLSGLSTGAYTLSGTDSKGCSASVSVSINEKIPPAVIHLDTLSVCAGVPATMSVHGAPANGVVYVWTVPAGSNNPGNVASFSATVAGVYRVVMTDTNTGCSISAQGEVRHTPGPDPDLCCSQSICAGQGTFLSSNNYTPLSFAWSTGATSRGISVNPLQSTTYTLTVTDAAGCKGTAQVSVEILPKPSVQIDSVPPICSGDTLTLRAVVSSGAAPYIYYWGSGSSSSTFKVSPSSTSTYTVSITDANGCMASAQVVVPVRTRPNVELGADQIVCTGTNATLRADVLNGTAPFTYAWNNGATQSLINVVSGTTTTYIVTVTDAIGCKSSDQVTVQVNPRPGLGFGSDTTICAGTNATLMANIIGGTAPFTYNWSNGSSASTLTVNPTSTSTYTLTVTDQKGCLAIGSTTVNVLPRPSVTIGPDRAICIGSSTTLSVNASSANTPLTYVWSNGASTSNLFISPSATTTYTITVTDSLTCSHSDTIIVVVNTTTAGISGNSSACVGQNTTLTATGGGTYLWSTGASTSSIVVSPSTTTTYTVTVTNQGCSDTATHVLNVPTTNVTLIAPNIFNTTDCQTGNIAFEVKYTGSSTPGLEFRMNGGAWQSSTWFTNRSAGTYLIEGRIVTATCILSLNSRSRSVSEASGATVIASISLFNASDCIGGNAGFSVNLTQNVSAEYRLFPSPNWNTSKYFSNLSSGKYIVEVRPRNSSMCIERDTIEFDEKAAYVDLVSITGLDDCIPGNLRIEISASGTPQSGPLQYRLGHHYSSNGTPWQSSNVLNNPPNASTFNRVQVKTSSGCVFFKDLDYNLYENEPLNIDITGLTYVSGATDCTKGNTRVSITTSTGEGVSVSQWRINGGAWTWSPEFYGLGRDSIFVEVRAYDDVRSCVVGKKLFVNERSIPDLTQLALSQQEDCVLGNAQISTQKTGGEGSMSYKLNTGSFGANPVFSNLGSGNYLVTVRDGNACQDTMSVRITEPALLAVTTSKANESDCTGGNARITVSATGARGILSYSLNGGTPQVSNIFNNLSNGTYTVTAQDGAGCTASRTVTINETGALIATPFKTGENDCVLGNTSVAINVTGALSTLSYRLNGGMAQSSNVFNNLGNGSHTISVQDAGGCSTSTTVTANESTPMALGTPQIQSVKCYGDASGSIGLNLSGGVTPYTITWSNGAQGAFIQHLPAGHYTFTVTDSRGCSVAAAASVPSPSAFQVQLSNFVDVACHNGTTGAISAVVTGGMSPHTYRWSNNATSSSITNIAAGNYGLTVTDANGCVATGTGSLANPAPLSLSHQVANDQDCIANNLSITAIASGGRGNYAFSLNGGIPQASGLFTGKTTGNYTLTLQDGAGCSAEALVLELIEAQPLGLSHQLLKDQDCIPNNAEVVPIPSQAQGSLSYLIAPLGTNNFTNLLTAWGSGSYLLKATDNRNCTAIDTVIIQEVSPPSLIAIADDSLSCIQPIAVLTATSSTPLQYQWRTANGTILSDNHTVSVDKPGAYILILTNNHACIAYDTVQIVSLIPLGIRVDTFPSTRCDSANAQLRIRVSNPGSWLYRIDSTAWDTSATFTHLAAGTYQLSIASALDTTCVLDTLVRIGSRETCMEICAGDSILIGKPGLNPWCMKWLPEDGLSNPDSSYTWVKPTNSTRYRLIITDDDGNILDSLMYNVTICPQLSVSPSQLNLCAADNPTLTVMGGAGPYVWRNEAGQIVGEGAVYAPTEPGLYTVEQVSSLSKASAASAQVSKQLGNQKLQIEPALAAICGDSVRLAAAGTYHNFVWRNAEGQIIGQDATIDLHQIGTYSLSAEVGVGCFIGPAFAEIVPDTFAFSVYPAALQLEAGQNIDSLDFAIEKSSSSHTYTAVKANGYQINAKVNVGCTLYCDNLYLTHQDRELPGTPNSCGQQIERTWTIRDACGNKATAIQLITFSDSQAPVFVQVPENATIPCGFPLPNEAPIIVDADDDAPSLSIQSEITTGSGCTRMVTRTWLAQDRCGNTATHVQTITYLEETTPDPIPDVTPDYNCGDSFTLPTINSSTSKSSLSVGEQINVAGFVLGLTQVSGSNGSFSGEGVVQLPFGNKKVLVEFSNISVNDQGQVSAGAITAKVDETLIIPNNPITLGDDICKPVPPKNAKNADGSGETGFNEDGEYTKQPPYEDYQPGDPYDPQYDPNGFDAEGNYLGTDSKYNEAGCNQEGLDESGQPCDPSAGNTPYFWLNESEEGPATQEGIALANEYRDDLREMVEQALAALATKLQTDADAQGVVCNGMRQVLNTTFGSLGLGDRRFVFGASDEYFKEGMWLQFATEPKPLEVNLDREGGMVELEKKHVELYHCDKGHDLLKRAHGIVVALQSKSGIDELVSLLLEKIQRFDAQKAAQFTSAEALLAWVKTEIKTTTDSRAADKQKAASNGTPSTGFRSKPAPDRGKKMELTAGARQTANELSAEALAEALEMHKQELRWQLDQGWEYIGGIHRAYYLEEIIKNRKANWFEPTVEEGDKTMLMPLEISKTINGQKYNILIDQVRFTPTGASCNAYLILEIPESGQKVVFRAENLNFSPAGAASNGPTTLSLGSDVRIRINNSAQLIIKGNESTFVSLDCSGFAGMGIAAEIEFCRDKLTPLVPGSLAIDEDPTKRVKAYFTAAMPSWGDYIASISVDPFAITGAEDYKWQVTDATLDMSQKLDPTSIVFPNNYAASAGGSWRGFYLKTISMTIPRQLNPDGLTVGAENLIIDDQGVTGSVFVQNVIPLDRGNLGGWRFSIDELKVNVVANQFTGGGLKGSLHIPLFTAEGNTSGTITAADCFEYQATIEPRNLYRFSVTPRSNMQAPLWKAKVSLSTGSGVEVKLENNEFTAIANLSGSLSIDTEIKAGFALSVPEIHFEGVRLSNRAPYFSAGTWSLPASIGTQIGGFELSVLNAGVKGQGDRATLDFITRIGLATDGVDLAAEMGLLLHGKLSTDGGRQLWIPDGADISEIYVRGDIKDRVFIEGGLKFFEQDGTYGTGFRGILNADFKLIGDKRFGITALAQFGKVSDFKYFLVDAMALLPSPGIALGPIAIRGFGGGVFNRMTRPAEAQSLGTAATGLPALGASLSGVTYTPSSSAGLGFKAAVILATTPKEELFNAYVSFEAGFSSAGSIDYLGFSGIAQMMAKVKTSQMSTKSGNPNQVMGSDIAAFVDLVYNFDAKTLDGKCDVSIVTPTFYGVVQAELHFSPQKWYILIGEPSAPGEFTFGYYTRKKNPNTGQKEKVFQSLANVKAYLMAGSQIPPLGELPAEVQSIAGASLRSTGSRSSTGGFAFGAKLQVGTGGPQDFLKIFYAEIDAGVGFDVALRDFGAAATCSNTGGNIGINGWYATGRAYAFVKAEVGILFKKKPFPIASLAVAASLQAELPNPFVATGVIGGRYKLLGGLVKGKFSFKFQLGEACELDCTDCPVDGQEQKVEVITALSPGANEEGVSPFTAPKAEFIGTLGGTINLYDDEGNPIDYRIDLESVKLTRADASEVFCRQVLSNDGRELLYQPFEVLPANTSLIFTVKVKLYRNGEYLESQEKSVNFSTGVLPANIAAENIAASYPIDGMQNFYRDEVASGRGFLTLQYGRSDLFSNGSQVEVLFLNAAGAKITSTPAEYLAYEQRINFAIPSAQLAGEQNYTLQLVQKQAGKEFTLCALRFRTSRYAKFWDKVEAFRQSATQSQTGLNIVLSAGTGAEAFDALELGKLIQVEAALAGNAWYEAQIRRHERWRNETNLSISQRPDVPLEKTVHFSSGTTLEYGAFAAAKSDFEELKAQAQQLVQEENEYCGQLHASSGCEQAGGCVNCPENPNVTLYEAAAANWIGATGGTYGVRFIYSIPGLNQITTNKSLNIPISPQN